MKFLRYNDYPIINLSQIVSITINENTCTIYFNTISERACWNLDGKEEFEKVWENLKSVLEHRDIIISI